MMDVTAYTRGYEHGTNSVDSTMSNETNHLLNESYDEIMARFDEEAENMREQGFPEDYVDGYADGYEQRLRDYEEGKAVGTMVAG